MQLVHLPRAIPEFTLEKDGIFGCFLELVNFFKTPDIYHIESNGEALLIFKFSREAPTKQVERMLQFTSELLEVIDQMSKI